MPPLTPQEIQQRYERALRKMGPSMSDQRPPTPTPTPNETFNQAFEEAVTAIAPDMPYLMHGAGDVTQVNPATAQLVANLTVQYIGKLVDAAIDSHEMLQQQPQQVTLPPPAFVRSRQPPKPAAPTPVEKPSKETKTPNLGIAAAIKPVSPSMVTLSPKKRRAQDDYWDEPLPEPKIRSKQAKKGESTSNSNTAAAAAAVVATTSEASVHVDEWVGVAGLDFFESRARKAFVQGPAAMSTASFIFPICHDVYTYGRVQEIQKTLRTRLQPLLMDPVVADMVRLEGKQDHAKTRKKSRDSASANAATGGNTSDPDEAEDEASSVEEDHEVPSWPGLEDMLPVHRSNR